MDYSESTSKRRKRRQHPHVTRVRNTIGVMIFRVLFAIFLVGGFAAAGAGIGIYLGILRDAPVIDMTTDLRSDLYNSFIIEARTGREIARLSGDENREWAPISRMPQHLLDAFVAIEDERFFTHNGVDPRGIVRALQVNLTTDRTEGASTITQQLIKNMQGLHRNDLISKLQEQYLAVQFERALIEHHGSQEIAKEIILESYLNMINLGRNWHGVQVAAWNYFGKDVSELTISESAVIAAITRHPSRYLPDRFPENNRYRQLLVLDNMLRLEMITEREHRMAVNDPVHDRVQSGMIAELASGVVHSYFVDALITQVVDDLVDQHFMTRENAFALVFGGGLRIYATKDQRIQDIIDDVFEDDYIFPVDVFEIDVEFRLTTRNEITNQISNHRRTGTVTSEEHVERWLDETREELLTANDIIMAYNVITMPQPQAAVVVMDHHNGHVLGISGGRGEKTANRSFCRATVATRSPGSQFKVVAAFLPGVDMGIFSAATHIVDEPWYFDDGHSPRYTPGNWWNTGHEGPTSVRRAIYRSANLVSVRAFVEHVGGDVALQYMQNMGFTTLEGELPNGRPFRDTHPSVPLGGLTLGVTQLELAGAYAAIANNGDFNRPVFYTRVLTQDGTVLLENGHNPTRVIRPASAYLLTDMMRDTVRRGTGPRANFREINMPIAGKTGTSQNTVDLGFTGYTPYFTAAVWLGFDQQQRMRNVQGAHLDIWRTIMERIHIDLEKEHRDFVRPEGVVTGTICRMSGRLPTDLCRQAGHAVTDLFVVGSVPSGHCDQCLETLLCALSGLPITDYCPPAFWVRGISPILTDGEHECPYHGPYNMEMFPPGGGFWGFPDLPGMPGQPGVPPGGGFWGFDPIPIPTQPPPQHPWDDPGGLPDVGDTPGDDGAGLPYLPPLPPGTGPEQYVPQPPGTGPGLGPGPGQYVPPPPPPPPPPDQYIPPQPPLDVMQDPFTDDGDDDMPGWF